MSCQYNNVIVITELKLLVNLCLSFIATIKKITTRGRRHLVPLITFEDVLSALTMIWQQAPIDDDKYSTSMEQMNLAVHRWSPIIKNDYSRDGSRVLRDCAACFPFLFLSAKRQKVLKESWGVSLSGVLLKHRFTQPDRVPGLHTSRYCVSLQTLGETYVLWVCLSAYLAVSTVTRKSCGGDSDASLSS